LSLPPTKMLTAGSREFITTQRGHLT
jgi:hypothetical protein